MHETGALGSGGCPGNDFALLELGAEAQKLMHPATLQIGGPTALGPVDGFAVGPRSYAYGASSLHGNAGVSYPGQGSVNTKVGAIMARVNPGYSYSVNYAAPAAPGDSSGPSFGPACEAIGAASTIGFSLDQQGTNHYTNIAKALEFMAEREGWAPELVVYESVSSTGI